MGIMKSDLGLFNRLTLFVLKFELEILFIQIDFRQMFKKRVGTVFVQCTTCIFFCYLLVHSPDILTDLANSQPRAERGPFLNFSLFKFEPSMFIQKKRRFSDVFQCDWVKRRHGNVLVTRDLFLICLELFVIFHIYI